MEEGNPSDVFRVANAAREGGEWTQVENLNAMFRWWEVPWSPTLRVRSFVCASGTGAGHGTGAWYRLVQVILGAGAATVALDEAIRPTTAAEGTICNAAPCEEAAAYTKRTVATLEEVCDISAPPSVGGAALSGEPGARPNRRRRPGPRSAAGTPHRRRRSRATPRTGCRSAPSGCPVRFRNLFRRRGFRSR